MSWCFPPRPCVVFLACAHLALFLALSLSPLFPRGVTIVCMFAYYSAFWEQNLTDVLDIELSHIAIELGPLKFFNETKRPAVPLQQISRLARLRAAVFIVRRREKLHRCEDVWSWLLMLNVMGLLYTRSVLRESSCLHYLLPVKRNPAFNRTLRDAFAVHGPWSETPCRTTSAHSRTMRWVL